MSVWVLGGSGMLGQAVQRQLRRHRVAHQSFGHALDIRDPTALQAAAERGAPTAIFNCAAFTQVDACESQEALAQGVNGDGPGHVAALAQRHRAAVLHVSTDYVFAGDAAVPYDEEAPCQPLGAYGRSKRRGEESFWSVCGTTPAAPAFVVRTAWLFGHGGKNFVSTMLRLMGTRPRLQVVADQIGRPTFCDDLADAMLRLLGLAGEGGRPAASGTYHFANAGQVSWHGFAAEILAQARACGQQLTCTRVEPITSADFPTPARRPAYSVLSTAKLDAALQRRPRPWQAALQQYLAAELAAPASTLTQTQRQA